MIAIKPRVWIELAITALVMLMSGVWATQYWNEWTRRGGEPMFYQEFFEPSVMIACGHGFASMRGERPAALDDFLHQRRDALSCSDLPAQPALGPVREFQPWRYLMYYVGTSWRILGVSWRGMGPAFGFLFGASVALVYGLCRLAMGRLPALGAAFAVSVSTLHLLYLPHLRDFAKEPFSLALFLILGLLVTRPPTYAWIAGLAAAYGAVLGIGYGFRTDFIIDIPLFLLVLALFVEGGPIRHLKEKLAGVAAFAVAFLIVAWPIYTSVYRDGGCQWHVALLGLTSRFDDNLHITPAPYDFGHLYLDNYVAAEVYGYARREALPPRSLVFCSHEYDAASGAYLSTIVRTFPGDMATRAFASVLRIAELPFFLSDHPLAHWHTSLYDARENLLNPYTGSGIYAVGAALLMAGAANPRLGLFLLFFVLFVGGYPAVQFQSRHHFHLEFISWFALGFVVNHAALGLWSLRTDARRHLDAAVRGAVRAVLLAAASAAVLVGALLVMRFYQERQAGALLTSYLASPRVDVDPSDRAALRQMTSAGPQFLDVELNLPACAPAQKVSFKYDVADPLLDFSRTVAVRASSGTSGTTSVLASAFDGFAGIELTPPSKGCVARVSRIADVRPFPLLLSATLAPGWERHGLYQRFADLEDPPAMRPFVALPPVSTWQVASGSTARRTLLRSTVVNGAGTPAGYQLMAPPVHVAEGATVTVRTNFSLERGRACPGALNYTGSRWLAPASEIRERLTFTTDATGGFRLVIANCAQGADSEPTRFSISRASYSTDEAPPR
jgi:hypothetical protein